MTDLSERTDHAERRDLSPAPEQHPAAGPPEIHFVPIEGERLEHLATERRGPLRWTASAVLSVQALVRKGPTSPTQPPWEAGTPGGLADLRPDTRRHRRRRAEAAVARRRRARRARRVGLARGAPMVPAVGRNAPEPMPASGWSWNAEDEKSWEAWEATATTGDTDLRLASLDTDLARPLPAPVRWAQLVGGGRLSRRGGRRRPVVDDG